MFPKWRVKIPQNPEVWTLKKQHSIWCSNSLSETFLFELILFLKKIHPFKIWLKGVFSLSLSPLSFVAGLSQVSACSSASSASLCKCTHIWYALLELDLLFFLLFFHFYHSHLYFAATLLWILTLCRNQYCIYKWVY